MTRDGRIHHGRGGAASAEAKVGQVWRPLALAAQRWGRIKAALHPARESGDAGGVPLASASSQLLLRSEVESCERLREEIRLRERWIAVVAHDLRTPVQAIQLTTHLLSKGTLDDTQRSLLQRLDRLSSRLAGLVDDTLDFGRARIGDGGIVLRKRLRSLRRICEDAIDEVQATRPERAFVLRASSDEEGLWDRDRIVQLLVHVVGNAASYAGPSSPVTVTLRAVAGGSEIAVHNRGNPIDARELPALFEPFRRGKDPDTNARGLGLGLYVAQAIARAHGGDIVASSCEHEGTIFRITLDGGTATRAAPSN